MAIKPHKVTPIARTAVFSTCEDWHVGEQPADQHKALFLESVWNWWKNRGHSKLYGNETPSQPGYKQRDILAGDERAAQRALNTSVDF